jgi:hypothetical protein
MLTAPQSLHNHLIIGADVVLCPQGDPSDRPWSIS